MPHNISRAFAGMAALALVSSPLAAAEVFKDDFDGDVLAEHWEVINPNPDTYIVEDGKVLMVFAEEATLDAENVPNTLRLNADLPKGNWQVTIRFEPEYQTLREMVYFGLWQDKANYMMGTLWVNSWCCYARNIALQGTKNQSGKKTSFTEGMHTTNHGQGQYDAYRDSFQNLGSAVLLRLTKKGRNYVFSSRVEGAKDKNGKETDWMELEKLTLLRQKGDLIIGMTQQKSGSGHVTKGGESIGYIDWVKIDAL